MTLYPCPCCGTDVPAYFNDSPYDVQITSETATARGVSEGDIVEWPAAYGLTAWGLVRIVESPAAKWPEWGRRLGK